MAVGADFLFVDVVVAVVVGGVDVELLFLLLLPCATQTLDPGKRESLHVGHACNL